MSGQVTVTCGVQGPQGPPGPAGALISAVTPVVTSQNINPSQNGALFTNMGASVEVDLQLPVASSPFAPMTFSLLVANALPLAFVAPAGVTITNGSDVSTAGGSISSNAVGNYLTAVQVSPVQWMITNITGIWDLEGPGPVYPPPSSISNIANATISETLSASQSTTMFTNTGAVAEIDLTLCGPTSPILPLTFSLLVTAAETFKFIAPSGVIITNGSDSSSAGGSISSNTIGNLVTLVMVSPTSWVVTGVTGTWELS